MKRVAIIESGYRFMSKVYELRVKIVNQKIKMKLFLPQILAVTQGSTADELGEVF